MSQDSFNATLTTTAQAAGDLWLRHCVRFCGTCNIAARSRPTSRLAYQLSRTGRTRLYPSSSSPAKWPKFSSIVIDGAPRDGAITAILLLLARLGLRAGEVVALTLDDIDWSAGHFTLRGKGGRWAQLPLPLEVGEAIADYLQNGRPRSASRRLFICQRAPHRGFADSSGISTLVKRALARAGIDSPRKGAHLFRHTLATEMLRRGASLTEIGELLRHQHPSTTTVYAKVNLPALRRMAQPWPGDGR